MRTWPLVLALAACQNSGGDDYVVVPGGPGAFGGGTTGGNQIDASIDGNGDGGTTTQRVCLVNDLRQPGMCATTNITGLKVTLGSNTTTTAADGTFVLAKPIGDNLLWHVSGTTTTTPALQVETTVMPYSGQTSLPVVSVTVYDDLVHGNGIPAILDQQGSLVVELFHASAPLAGAKLTLNPTSGNATFYDSTSAATWNTNATGSFGVAWAPGVTVGTQMFTVVGTTTPTSAVIENQAITFVTQQVP